MRDSKNWKLWSGLVVLFLTGVFIGALGMGIYQKHRFERITAGGATTAKRLMTERLAAELNLTSAQRVEIDRIINEMQRELSQLRQKHRPEIEAILSRGIAAMKTHLTPEQQEKLDDFFERRKERWERKRRHRLERRGE